MTSDPVGSLREVAGDGWGDPVDVAFAVGRVLLELTSDDWSVTGLRAVRELRSDRPDAPLILAATEQALDSDPTRARIRLERFLSALTDTEWAGLTADLASHHQQIAVTSLGSGTLTVLDEGLRRGAQWETLIADRRYVLRGLGYLRLPASIGAPEEADTVLIPAVAGFENQIWTTVRHADIVTRCHLRETPVIPILHPLARLSARSRVEFRPLSYLVEVEL